MDDTTAQRLEAYWNGLLQEQRWFLERLRRYGLVYLATPYTKYSQGLRAANLDACAYAGALVRAGIHVFCPIAHSHALCAHNPDLDARDGTMWLDLDRKLMPACDALVVASGMPGWYTSVGVTEEINYFRSRMKPVFYVDLADDTIVEFQGGMEGARQTA